MRGRRTLVVAAGLLWVASAGLAQQTVGWRTDGTSRYPDATPPTEWGPEKNVIWKTKTPGWGNTTPVIVGDRIFITCQRATLMCIRKTDGKILWQKSNDFRDFVSADELAKFDGKQAREQSGPIAKEIRGSLCQAVRKTFTEYARDRDNAEKKARWEAACAKVDQEELKLDPILKYTYAAARRQAGSASHTPVSNGKVVCAIFSSGVAACYDLEGKRKWIRHVQRPRLISATGYWRYAHANSPALVGNTLIAHFHDLWGLDVETGRTLWRTRADISFGVPIPTKIGGQDVVVTPKCDVVRVSDGELLGTTFCIPRYSSAIVQDSVAYFTQDSGKGYKSRLMAVRLERGATSDRVKLTELWSAPMTPRFYASPLHYGGLIYTVNREAGLAVVEADTGKPLYTKKLDLPGKGFLYSSPVGAGKYVYISRNKTTIVLQAGREYEQVARNELDEIFRATLVFEGKRMYVRGLNHLWCIGKPPPKPADE